MVHSIGKPYNEIKSNQSILRTFSKDVDESELVWHRDKRDRYVRVITSDNWQLQLDNELPQVLIPEQHYFIPKETYHRIIKGNKELTILIKES